jgi:hypothetical protein
MEQPSIPSALICAAQLVLSPSHAGQYVGKHGRLAFDSFKLGTLDIFLFLPSGLNKLWGRNGFGLRKCFTLPWALPYNYSTKCRSGVQREDWNPRRRMENLYG